MKELALLVAKPDPETGMIRATLIIDGQEVVVVLKRSVAASAIEHLAQALAKG